MTYKNHSLRIKIIITCALLLTTLYLFSMFPLSGDDWNRLGMSSVTLSDYAGHIKVQWTRLNGRVLGNLVSMVWIGLFSRITIRLSCLVALWLLTSKLIKVDLFTSFVFTLASILLLPKEIFREVWVWSMGFYNYVPPIVLGALGIHLYAQNGNSQVKFLPPVIFITSLASCLFMENISLFMVIAGIAAVGYSFISRSKYRLSFSLFLGALAGFVLMYSSPVYRRVAVNEDTYRTMGMSASSIIDIIKTNWTAFSRYLVSSNLLFIALTILLFAAAARSKKLGKLPVILYSALGVSLAVCGHMELSPGKIIPSLLVHLHYYLMLLYLGVRVLPTSSRIKYLILVFSVPLIMGPLLIVTPVGARNFFTPAFIQMLITLYLINESSILDKDWIRVVTILVLVVVSCKLVFLVPIYSSNYSVYKSRIELVRNAIVNRQTLVSVPPYPYPNYIHGPDTDKMNRAFYLSEPGDINIEVQDHN